MSLVITDYIRPDVIASIDNMNIFFDEYLDFLREYKLEKIDIAINDRKRKEYERRRSRIIEEVTNLVDEMSNDERHYCLDVANQINEKLAEYNKRIDLL